MADTRSKPLENMEKSSSAQLDDHIISMPGKKIVIIGDGPIALLAAVKLKLQNVEDVTIIGPRLGTFTRSNDIIPGVFEIISAAIDPLSVQPSYAHHIKDIERQLYIHGKKLKVKMINKIFDRFAENKKLILVTPNEPEEEIDADIVFDCTGVKRDVINKFNQSQSNFQFEIKKVEKYNKKHFAAVRVIFHSNTYVNNLTHAAAHIEPTKNPFLYDSVMEELHKLGWNSFKYPLFYVNAHKKTDTLYKSFIYTEIPENIASDKIIDFIKVLIKFSLQGTTDQHPELILKKSKKGLPPISIFHTHPHQVTPGYFGGNTNFPMIFHLGDASGEVAFHLARGIIFGTGRLLDTFNCFTFGNNEIIGFDKRKFSISFEKNMSEHAKFLQEYAEHNQKEELSRNEDILSKYRKMVSTSRKTEKANNTARAEARLEFVKGQQLINPYFDINTETNQNTGFIIDQHFHETLIKALNHFSKAFLFKKTVSNYQFYIMLNYILEVADRCKKMAETSLKQKKHSQARWAYQISFDIYSKLISLPKYTHQQLEIILNLIKIAHKQHDYVKILALSNDGKNEIFKLANKMQSQSILDNIYFYTAIAALELTLQELGKMDLSKFKTIAENAIGCLSDKSKVKRSLLTSRLLKLNGNEKQIISLGQALLLLMERYHYDKNLVAELKELYLVGTDDDYRYFRILNLIEGEECLANYHVSFNYQVVSEDSTRRYFESRLVFETLKTHLDQLKSEDLTSHYFNLKLLLPSIPIQIKLSQIERGETFSDEHAIAQEFSFGIKAIFNQPCFDVFSLEQKVKLKFLLASTYAAIEVARNITLPMNIYDDGFFQDEHRGRIIKDHKNIKSHHRGLIKSYMPLSLDDLLITETSYPFQKSADNCSTDHMAAWPKHHAEKSIHPFSCSISGVMVCVLRCLKHLSNKNRNVFTTENTLSTYLKCLISISLFNSGGHSLFEYVSTISLEKSQAEFTHIKDFDKIGLISLFLMNNDKAFNEALHLTKKYNKQILARQKTRNELRLLSHISSTLFSSSHTDATNSMLQTETDATLNEPKSSIK